MKKRKLLLAAPILLLGACSQGGGGGPDRLSSGRWEMNVSFDTIEAAGLPETQKGQMLQMMNQALKARSTPQCLDGSGDQLQKMREALTAGTNGGGGPAMNCEYGNDDRFGGGVMKIQATCRPAGAPAQVRLSLDGTFTADALDSAMEMNVEGQQPGGQQQRQMRLVGKMTGRRIGDC